MEDYFSIEWGWHGDGFRMIQAHYIYYALCFLFFFFLSFIYLFLAVLGLCCCAGRGFLSNFGAWASLCRGSSCVGAQASRACRLSSCRTGVSLPRGMWIFPRPVVKPMSPVLAGRFHGPPGKSYFYYYHYYISSTSDDQALDPRAYSNSMNT